MKIAKLVLILGLMTAVPAFSQAHMSEGVSKKLKTASEKKLEREILKAELSLGKAIARRDVIALDKLLTDYYADAFEGSERALNKRATLARCRDGSLHFYKINEERTISLSVDIVTVEGNAAAPDEKKTQREKERDVHVKRWWTKKDGRWQLVGQTIGPADDDSER
jgi:hypothetical protein